MSNKAVIQKETKLSLKEAILKIEIWLPDESVFGVELPATFTVHELQQKLVQHFNLDQEQWCLCSNEGKVFKDDEIMRDIVGNSQELKLKRLRIVPKPKWG